MRWWPNMICPCKSGPEYRPNQGRRTHSEFRPLKGVAMRWSQRTPGGLRTQQDTTEKIHATWKGFVVIHLNEIKSWSTLNQQSQAHETNTLSMSYPAWLLWDPLITRLLHIRCSVARGRVGLGASSYIWDPHRYNASCRRPFKAHTTMDSRLEFSISTERNHRPKYWSYDHRV